MNFIKQRKLYKPNYKYFDLFMDKFWFIPSDVLQRSLEASIWDLCRFNNPILDIGIGNGEVTPLIFNNIRLIDVGIDIEPDGLEQAMRTGKYKKVLCEDASKMKFKNASFNTVVSNSTFEHIQNDLKAISEVSRVLKKYGLCFLTVPSSYLPEWILEFEKNNPNKKLNKFNKRANHNHYRGILEWEKIFNKNGMKIEFYKFYFSKDVAIAWYKMFKFFTHKLNNKEIWSYVRHSKLSKLIPKCLFKQVEKILLKSLFDNGFFTNNNQGAMLFMIAKKL